ncbi:hypothetical protein KQI86_06015 [Clostridium sp. MSJ-11]|uniref:Uncharacterized protein n=1 Tax=Clostridium mobile TaxID=2841512 RepID=A0ABS6EGI1_9CLOT|nr:hypothetical protein [Clostridium mobile]MBU5483877.1 hypothetical protein [Clostridium mobile]
MDKKIKIKISNNAYNQLVNLFKYDDEYNCLKLTYNQGCCKTPKVSILLDTIKEMDFVDKVEDISIVYDKELADKVNEIQLIYTNKGFMVKATSLNETNETKGCALKGNCNGCSKASQGCPKLQTNI